MTKEASFETFEVRSFRRVKIEGEEASKPLQLKGLKPSFNSQR